MKIIQLFFCFLLAGAGYSQNVINVDANPVRLSNRVFYTIGGAPFSPMKYVRVVDGSPYFSETWMKGTILSKDSMEYSNIRLRLDLLEGTLIYLNEKDEEMVSVAPIREVSLTDTLTDKTYFFIHSSDATGSPAADKDKIWYQVLTGEAVSLYKQYFKDIYESKAYASSITEQTIRTDERYFIRVKKIWTRVKKLRNIANILFDKGPLLVSYIEKNKLNGKKEEDFIAVVNYYNSLK